MTLSAGQQLALQQLREIASFGPRVFEIVAVTEPAEQGGTLRVQVSVDCSGMPRAAGGLPLRKRERLDLLIPPDSPFRPPAVWATHKRFAGFPHVQWARYLCLYRSTEIEWSASDGMYGAIERLDDWLRQGALNQLDPSGEPLHPPAVYASSDQLVVPEADTPLVEGSPWFGFALLKRKSETRVHINGWMPIEQDPSEGETAAALLLPTPMPFEYPGTVRSLVAELGKHGISQRLLFITLKLAALTTVGDRPLFLVVGAPMRGIAGAAQREQHLAVWCLDPTATKGFRLMVTQYPEINEKVEAIMLEWAETAKVHWCEVREQRPAVTIRRDHDTPLSWLRGKSVSLWGCGALGSHIGEYLARAGVGKISLQDSSSVSPGVLARQLFDDADVGRPKAIALAERLKRISPDLPVTPQVADLHRTTLTPEAWAGDADIVIDATASRTVALKLESVRGKARLPVVSMAIGHRAERGLVTIAQPLFGGGPFDVERRTKIEVCNRPRCAAFRDEFWPERDSRPLFQPEPGCSSPTFIGSAADIAALAGSMLNVAALQLARLKPNDASADFIDLPRGLENSRTPSRAGFIWGPDHVATDPYHSYQVRIAPSAIREIRAWISRNARVRGGKIETGGLLFGEFNEPTKIVWVTEVSGPPPDSQASAEGFLCGVAGTKEDNAERKARSKGSVSFIGMWHTHPVSKPIPSGTDLGAMYDLLVAANSGPRHTLMLIVGDLETAPRVGAYVFTRRDFVVIRQSRQAPDA